MTTPITTQQLIDASADVATISRVANDLTATTTTRNGGTIDTLYGAISKLKYSVPVAFGSGIVVNSPTITVLQAGVVYAPLLSAIPFTTTGTFNGSQWYPIAPTFSTFVAGITNSADAAAFRTAIGAAGTTPDLNTLTTDATGGALGDLFPFVDVSESNASNKATLPDILKTLIPLLTADTTPELAADSVISFDNSASLVKRVLLSLIGAGKQTVFIPAGAMYARTDNGASAGGFETTTNKVNMKSLDFDPSTQKYAQFGIRMPKSWNRGTVTFMALWSHAATTVNFGVAFSLRAVAISDNEAIEAAFGTAVVVTDTGGTTDRLYQTGESTAVTIAGTPAANDYVVFEVARVPADAGDTMAINARLHGVVLFYTTEANTDL
jgi:hypothetical protein